jgi:DNA (cytosine-5)-methyltransferase 1
LFPQWNERNLGDITACDYSHIKEPIDLLVYSTPCQSVSTAGLNKGMAKGSDTASSVIWAVENAIKQLRPKYLLMENVKGIVSKRNIGEFEQWKELVKSYGYVNFQQILNAKDYGVPQNRERVFLVSIRDDGDNPTYVYPDKISLELRLKDILETSVDESFYLRPEQVQRIVAHCDRKVAEGCGFKTNFTPPHGISGAIKTKEGSREYDTYVKESTV